MKIPESIYINPKAIAKVYSLSPHDGFRLVEYVPKERLDAVQKKLEDLEEERRKDLLTHREIYPRG